MHELPETLQYAPMPLLIVDGEDIITALNDAALAMGFAAGNLVADYVDGLTEPFCEYIRYQPASAVYRFRFQDSEKPCKVSPITFAEMNCLWIQDMAENLALADQLRQIKQPAALQSRQINQLVVTAMGYSELLDVVMNDSDAMTADKAATVKQYQGEISRNLRAIQQLLDGKETQERRGNVLVVEKHETLAELISELLRGEGYKVTAFSDPGSSLKFLAMNLHSLQFAIVDDEMTSTEGERSMLDEVTLVAPELSVLRLTNQSDLEGSIRKPLDFKQLLAAVQNS